MNALIIIGIGTLLVVLSTLYRNNKMLTWIMYIFMWVVYTFCNAGNPDLEVYTWTYYEHIYVTSPGFDLAMFLFESIGLPFCVFKGVCGLFTLYFYRKSLKTFFKYENLVLALCVIYPFTTAIAQIRNGIMAAVVLYATSEFIIDSDKQLTFFVRIVMVAILIHPVAIVYLVILLAKKYFKESNRLKFVWSVLFILAVEIILTQNLIYDIASIFIKNEKYLSWFNYENAFAMATEDTLNWKGKLVPALEQLMGTGIVVYAVKLYKRRYTSFALTQKKSLSQVFTVKQLNVLKYSFILLLFVLPFYQISPTYFRVFMNMTPLIYVVVIQLVGQIKGESFIPKKVVFLVTFIYAVLLTYLSELGYTISMLNSFSIR